MLRMNSLLKRYDLANPSRLFFWLKGKDSESTRFPLPIKEFYVDFLRTMVALHIIELDWPNERTLIVETNFEKEFRSIAGRLESIFHYLTNHPIEIRIESQPRQGRQGTLEEPPLDGTLTLFSAGLDSMCCAAKLNAENKRPILTHIITEWTTFHDVQEISKSRFFRRSDFFCVDATTKALKGGFSNTRGLVFYSAAYAIAASLGLRSFSLGENGSQMLDIMLGQDVYYNSQSTMNTNPNFIMKCQSLFSAFDEKRFNIECIFKNMTRAEAIATFSNQIPWKQSWSCFTRRGRSQMCGLCYNCFVRRMSILAAGIEEDAGAYENNPFLIGPSLVGEEYKRKEDIIYYLLTFYAKVLRNDAEAKSKLELLTGEFFKDPVELATRFGLDIYLAVLKSSSTLNRIDLSGIGRKAIELLKKSPIETLRQREKDLMTLGR